MPLSPRGTRNGPHLPPHPLQTGSRLGVGVFVFDDDDGTDEGGGLLNTSGGQWGGGSLTEGDTGERGK